MCYNYAKIHRIMFILFVLDQLKKIVDEMQCISIYFDYF